MYLIWNESLLSLVCKEYGLSCHLWIFHSNGTRLEKIALKSSDVNSGLRVGGGRGGTFCETRVTAVLSVVQKRDGLKLHQRVDPEHGPLSILTVDGFVQLTFRHHESYI